MGQIKDDLTLGTGLIRKGEAKGISPALAVRLPAEEPAAPAAAPAGPPPPTIDEVDDEPPLRAAPPDDVPKRFTSFRLPVTLDEELRAMIYETRRSKQDLLIEFVTAGVQQWRKERAKRK
jgi:hypothetical protein